MRSRRPATPTSCGSRSSPSWCRRPSWGLRPSAGWSEGRGDGVAITLTQLGAFLAVVRRGSVTAAAEELVVTQPSVSAAVAALERELGAKLTERDGRGLKPTAAGLAFAPYAEHVLGLLEQGGRAAREAVEDERRTLRVSAVATAGEHFAPLVI